jgi:outer membrane protein TolC
VKKSLKDVENSFYAYKMADENLKLAKKLFDSVLKEYKIGRYNVFRLKDALSNLTKAKENYNIRLISYNISLINLDMVVGRITKRFGVNPKKFLEDFGK